MQIIKGRNKGRTAKMHQFANDWISVDFTDEAGGTGMVSPRHVRLETEEEQDRFIDANPQHTGVFWDEWELQPDGTFAQRRRR